MKARSMPRRYSCMVSAKFFLGLPLPRLPSGVHFIAWIALLSSSMRATCPIHLSLLPLMLSSSFSCPVFSLIALFVILSRHEMCRILLSHLWCAASRRFLFATVIDQVSEPYNRVLITTASYNLILILRLHPLLFQIFSSLPKAAFAFPILVFISLSQLLS